MYVGNDSTCKALLFVLYDVDVTSAQRLLFRLKHLHMPDKLYLQSAMFDSTSKKKKRTILNVISLSERRRPPSTINQGEQEANSRLFTRPIQKRRYVCCSTGSQEWEKCPRRIGWIELKGPRAWEKHIVHEGRTPPSPDGTSRRGNLFVKILFRTGLCKPWGTSWSRRSKLGVGIARDYHTPYYSID